jgi:hypothetical protein
MSRECRLLARLLEPFVDGELVGVDRLRVAQHLETCATCASEAQAIREIGESLRQRAVGVPLHQLAGLASSVVSRTRAEKALSWQSRLARACEDWHWAIVGLGSCAATLISTLLVSAILTFGPAPERQDSLSGVIKRSGDAFVLACAERLSIPEDIMLLDYDAGSAHRLSFGPCSRPQTEADLVGDLAATFERHGSVLALSRMDPADRLKVEALLDEILRLRLAEPQMVGRPVISNVAVSSAISWRSAGTVSH